MWIFLAFASKSESLAVSAYQVRVFSVSTVVEIYKSTTQEGAVFDKQSHPCGKQCPVLDKNVRDAQWCSVMRRKKVCDVTHNFTILKMSMRRKVMAKRLCWMARIRKYRTRNSYCCVVDRREYEKKIFTDSESVLSWGAVCRAAKSMAVSGTMAQRHDLIDDSVQVSNLPHIAW